MSEGNGDAVLSLAEARARKQEADEEARAVKDVQRMRRQVHMLAALVRSTGRVRIKRADLEAVTDRSRLAVQVQDNGDLVLTFLEG